MKNTLSTLCILAVLSQASAATFVTSAPATGAATGSYTTVFQAGPSGLVLQALGAYDSDANGLTDSLTVTVYAYGGGSLGSTTISGTGDGRIGSFVYNNLGSPISLTANTFYTIGVSGFTATTPFNSVTFGTFNSSLTPGGAQGGGFVDGNGNAGTDFSGNSFAAGSFSTVAVTPVPEPETYAMLAGLGLVGFGLYRRCRK